MLNKTRETIKYEIIPKIMDSLPNFRPKKPEDEISLRLNDIEKVTDAIVKKMDEERQYSGAFDLYHQKNPSGIAPNVLEQLYGRNLWFLREYYQICSPLDKLIFGKRYDQFEAVAECVADNPSRVGWRVVHKLHGSPNFKTNKETDQKCRWFEALIQNPNKDRHPGGFTEVGKAMLESKMLFDRIPIEKLEHKKWIGYGLPASYLIPDAATIKPTTWVLYAMSGAMGYSGRSNIEKARSMAYDTKQIANQLLPRQEAYRQVAKQLAINGSDSEAEEYRRLTDGIIKWVQQMPDSQIAAGYTDKNLSMFIGNHSPQINAWGWSSGSAFERSFAFGEVIFKMTGYNQEIFDSKMPEGLLAIQNTGYDKKSKQQMYERMHDEGADRYSNLLVQFVNDPDKDIKYHQLRDKPKEMQFKEMFILYAKLKCAAYGMDYTELNLEDGKSGGLGGSGAHEKRMDANSAVGIEADTRYIAHCITKALIEPWDPSYKMEFVHDVTETEAQVKLKKEKMGYTSLYETRMEENLDGEWWKSAPEEFQEELKEISKVDYIPGIEGTGRVQLISNIMQMRSEKEMQEQEQAHQGMDQEEPEGEQQPQENPEITKLKAAIWQQDKGNEQDMGKSLAIQVEHRYFD